MNEEIQKPTKGTWDNLGKKKDITFEVNEIHQLTFLTDKPEELQSNFDEDSVYYRFSVKKSDGTESVLETSAWTLLSALKELAPLKNKRVQITKKLIDGRQKYVVVEII
jgi:hypothetical protein